MQKEEELKDRDRGTHGKKEMPMITSESLNLAMENQAALQFPDM
jgi:hypothetical protein